ncbi:MAG: RT0821/Lpp0805 family surface protein [Rhizobiaceae bacterium]|jgi:hypothetical protein|nr:RT0821/Lpp0805 family surface protein [Rhizobiaceae bacterium]
MVTLFPAIVLLQACASDAGLPDPGLDPLVTRSVPGPLVVESDAFASAGTQEADARADALLVCGLAASLKAGGPPVDWQNPDTGSTGMIHGIADTRGDNGASCRSFSALRSAYDGVRNHSGEICRVPGGPWRVMRFDAL